MVPYVALMVLTTAGLTGVLCWRRRHAPAPREVGWGEVLAAGAWPESGATPQPGRLSSLAIITFTVVFLAFPNGRRAGCLWPRIRLLNNSRPKMLRRK